MKYVDGFVFVIENKKFAEYKKMAQLGAKIWKEHGALEYFECIGDEMEPQGPMKILPFPKMTKAKKGEKVIFSFIIYKNKKHRDSVNKKVMAEMAKNSNMQNMSMPFDMKRMAFGGFEVIVEK